MLIARTVGAFLLLSSPFASADERLVMDPPIGWKVVVAEEREDSVIIEYAKADDQTPTEGISLQATERRDDLGIKRLMEIVVAGTREICQEFDARPFQIEGASSEFQSLGLMIVCGRNRETGQGEVRLARGIEGHDNLYVVQKSWRVAPFTAAEELPVSVDDRSLWLRYLARGRVCDTAADDCP
ncbi:MAG: hypothetical protein AAF384_19230 [Pseudomonadota bacterium]